MRCLDIADLVKSALVEVGCDPSLIGTLDGHSTIVLDFHDLPSIYITAMDEGVWIWSRIVDYHEAVLNNRAANILRELMKPSDYILNGFSSLCEGERELEFKVLVKEHYLSEGRLFAKALNGFFDRVESLCAVIK